MRVKKDINVRIGERIKRAREVANLTQERFAELIEVSAQYVSDLERGKVGIAVDTLKRVCEVLLVSCDAILMGRIEATDISPVVKRLEHVSPQQLVIVEAIINKHLEGIALTEKTVD